MTTETRWSNSELSYTGVPMTDDNAAHRIACMMMEVADAFAAFPRAEVDVRAWQHLLIYMPKDRLALRVSGDKAHAAADAFWKYWRENGETHKHGYYESTWGAINAALRTSGVVMHASPVMPQGGTERHSDTRPAASFRNTKVDGEITPAK